VILSETEENLAPYKYVRTFKEKTKAVSIADFNKEELQDYLNALLDIKDPKSASREIPPS
jgi:hypothetical protein